MPNNKFINLEAIEMVAKALGDLNNDVLYVGGAVVSLYATDSAAEEARPTEDIDISVKISSYNEMSAFTEKLRDKNIHLDIESSIMYRYKYQGISIDFIPFEDTSVGPTNSWLKPSFDKAQLIKIGNENIRIPPVSLFLSNKWEAYGNRGTDPRTSKDFEDIIYILDNNIDLIQDIENAANDVKEFLSKMADFILNHVSRDEIIDCHLNAFWDDNRKDQIVEKLHKIMETNNVI